MLQVDKVCAYYGEGQVLHDVSLKVEAKEIVALIGANGAGKTTTLKTIIGLVPPRRGTVTFMGERIDGLPTYEIVKKGVSLVLEGRRVFPQLTVAENLEVGSFCRRDRREVAADIEEMYTRFRVLRERRNQYAGSLSGGEQQMLAIARALVNRPKLLLLDEPSMGLAPIMVEQTFEIIKETNKRGVPILLVEQNARMALAVAQRGYVIQNGSIMLEGSASSLAGNEMVRKLYLGEVTQE
ncbi:MAG: ABC transporter ATP-binding protein [Firmicutes bacterium]|jgi:branched-chain amino acid transport system ATP-binding protein|nr:ABC transporter ATP-binding protein [Bacillota bacterium]